jgi:DNA-directed RNA polymerase subunit M/transcription elongation factor TFIIS
MARRISKKAKHDCRQCGKALPLSVLMDGHKLVCSECGRETNLLEALSKVAARPARLHTKKKNIAVKTQIKGAKRVNHDHVGQSADSQSGLANHRR